MPQSVDEQTFEQHFAELALATLKTQSPALIDYMMGFQLVEKNDEDTRAVGFFAFQVGKQWVYVPCFFLNGEIKGTELMYVKGQDIFLPNEEGWINYLIQKKPFQLGSPEKRTNPSEQGITAPDLRRLVRPPQASKLGSAGDQFLVSHIANDIAHGSNNWREWAEPFRSTIENMEPSDKVASVPGLPDLLAKHGLMDGFVEQMQKDAKLASSVLKFYTPDDFLKAAKAPRELKSGTKVAPRSKAQVLIVGGGDVWKDHGALKVLTDEEKRQALEGNVVVRDGRAVEQTPKVFDVDVEKAITNPDAAGLYDMLCTDGTFKKVLITKIIPVGSGANGGIWMIIDPDKKVFRVARTTEIWVAPAPYSREDWIDELNGLGSSCENPSVSVGSEDRYIAMDGKDAKKPYTIISQGGESLNPFYVDKKMDRADGTTSLLVSPITVDACSNDFVGNERRTDRATFRRLPGDSSLFWTDDLSVDMGPSGKNWDPNSGSMGASGPILNTPSEYDIQRRIVLTDKPIRRIVRQNDTAMVPKSEGKGCRMVQLKPADAGECDPGNTADLYTGIGKFSSALEVFSDGLVTKFIHNGNSYASTEKKAAYDILMRKIGLHRIRAEGVIEKVASKLRVTHRFFVENMPEKTAAPFDELINRTMSFDPAIDAPMNEPQEELFTDMPEYRSRTDRQVYRHYKGENDADYRGLYGKTVDQLNEAASTGQKDVFDASALGSLINTENISDEVDSYISDLIQAVDKLGRILFLTYWHNEELQDRYGKAELPQLEDNLKSVFQSLGDTVLELRKRSPTDNEAFGRGILDDLGD